MYLYFEPTGLNIEFAVDAASSPKPLEFLGWGVKATAANLRLSDGEEIGDLPGRVRIAVEPETFDGRSVPGFIQYHDRPGLYLLRLCVSPLQFERLLSFCSTGKLPSVAVDIAPRELADQGALLESRAARWDDRNHPILELREWKFAFALSPREEDDQAPVDPLAAPPTARQVASVHETLLGIRKIAWAGLAVAVLAALRLFLVR